MKYFLRRYTQSNANYFSSSIQHIPTKTFQWLFKLYMYMNVCKHVYKITEVYAHQQIMNYAAPSAAAHSYKWSKTIKVQLNGVEMC